MTEFEEPEFEPQDAEPKDEAGDPAPSTSAQEAFEALRETVERQGRQIGAEMTVVRRGVEAAFDRFEAIGQPTDYSADLGRLVQGLAVVGERLKAIEASPILKNGPEHYARVLERGGESLVRTVAQQLERQAADLERAGNRLAAYTNSAYDRRNQDVRMWTAGGFGLVLGLFLLLILPRFLPYSADSHVASLVMGRDRVSAGMAMIEAADPEKARNIEWSSQFYENNAGGIGSCFEAARKTGKDQTCTITVGPPVK